MRTAPLPLLASLALTLAAAIVAWPAAAAPAAPTPVWPPPDYRLHDFSPTMTWTNPPGATQYQVQVLPFNGDGPGLNLVRALEDAFTIPAPTLGQGNYILLPDMSYTWRVRVSDAPGGIGENDPSWGPWSVERVFRTPRVTAEGLSLTAPSNGTSVSTESATLQWTHASPHIFYYEVQVSPDPEFRVGADAVAPVWWNLVHGGTTTPLNSWTTPGLESGMVYYWRVRPRVQGDGTPVEWSPPWRFTALPPLPCCRASVRVDNDRPLTNTTIRITGRLTDGAGAPIAGAPMTATLRTPGQAWPTCSGGLSDSNGEASCTANVGFVPGVQVVVEVRFVHLGTVWTATTSVLPR